MTVAKEKQIIAALQLQQQPAPAKHLSTWCVPPVEPAIKIRNSKEAFRFIIEQEATQGFAAIFLNRYNHLICYRYFLEDFENPFIICHTAKQYGAEALYLIHFKNDNWVFPTIPFIELFCKLRKELRAAGILFSDVLIIGDNEHRSMRRDKYDLS